MTEATWRFGSLRPMKYGLILADPPWQYEMYGEAGYDKSPEAHYDTLSDDEICAFPVHELATGDCLLILWAIWPKLQSALTVMHRWGFRYKTGGSWTKTTRTGKRAFGTGYILRSTTEPFLVGTIGAPEIGSRSVRNLIESPRRAHSQKPPEMRVMADKLCPRAFGCELFAADPWPGHDTWGLPHRGPDAVPRAVPAPAEPVLAPMPLFEGS
ncbi:MAG: S-adenosylmethionine-binding protein [Rhizobiales bacterium 24-66-13]|jgi:N6-adenosine-specific RNA methylase IME4|nr:MAG: S-adenosylmethionine-binding protein [Rhizobiales bacterium 35-66-30]OYZ82798.1 MAG: S-adenosylmethionine-binding protein [Rhizobiales bacterium 24-66-13]OZB11831.1 MAG: S-adenosylmethionine-binding protein [Rhizobiales bacterium 39-66-18]HQS09496.1 MT-A70 family methyltransferase [Xanthobacteraceae bacterium]HQS45945.1 MT-A70 family methyltransferase [Xanthobacteraceae bacterium]